MRLKEQVPDHNLGSVQINTSDIAPKDLHNLERILKVCQQNHVKALMMSSPMPEETVRKTGIYGDVYNYFKKIANRNGAPYVDHNLDRESVLSVTSHFTTIDHLNKGGVEIFS